MTKDVRIDKVGELGRKVTIRIPFTQIEKEKETRLKKLAPKIRKDGFRPGKVPFAMIKKDYGHDVYHEVIEDLMKKSFEKTMKEHNLTPADRPQIRVLHTDHQHAAECAHEHGEHAHDHDHDQGHHHAEAHAHEHHHATGDDYFEYEASFDVYPEITLPELSTIVVEKWIPVITEANIEDGLRRLQHAHATYVTVEHGARKEDRVQAHVKGTLVTAEAPFMDDKMEIALGQNAFLPEFEKHIVGIKKGETRTFQITFPDDYEPTMAGKKAEFVITAEDVEAAELPELDQDFCDKIGFPGDVAALKEVIRSQMQDNAQATTRKMAHEKVLEALRKAVPVTLPTSLVEKEIQEISHGKQHQDLHKVTEVAEGRVAFSLLLGQFIREHNVQTNPERVREVIRNVVGGRSNSDEMLKWLLKDSQRMARIQAMALEETALDELLAKVTTSEKEVSFDEIMKKQES